MNMRTEVAKPSTSVWVDLEDASQHAFSSGPAPGVVNTLFGATLGGQNIGPAQVVRSYSTNNANIPTTWAGIAASSINGVETGDVLAIEGIRPGGINNGCVGWSSNSTYRTQLDQYLAAIPDIPKFRLTCVHEPEDASRCYGSTNTAAFLTDSAYFASRVRAASLLRANPFIIVRCFMGYSLGNNPSLINAMCANPGDYDELGTDIYDLSQINLTKNLAATLNKPWLVAELGQKTIGAGATTTDAAVLSMMQSSVPGFRGSAQAVCWFDSGTRNILTDKPNSTAFWATVCQGGPP